jgi:hypothetical protein
VTSYPEAVRTAVLVVILVSIVSTVASADDTTRIRMRRHGEAQAEPWLHLDATTLDSARAEGGLIDGRAAILDLGPRTRLAAEASWWQTGLAPSMFAEDLGVSGWRASAELSYDLGPFRIGMNASMSRNGDNSHRMIGLFAFRTFRLSRWMHAWIMVGVAYEQWDVGRQPPLGGTRVGLSLGTTFR